MFRMGKPTLLEWMLCKPLDPRESRRKLEFIEMKAAYSCDAEIVRVCRLLCQNIAPFNSMLIFPKILMSAKH